MTRPISEPIDHGYLSPTKKKKRKTSIVKKRNKASRTKFICPKCSQEAISPYEDRLPSKSGLIYVYAVFRHKDKRKTTGYRRCRVLTGKYNPEEETFAKEEHKSF